MDGVLLSHQKAVTLGFFLGICKNFCDGPACHVHNRKYDRFVWDHLLDDHDSVRSNVNRPYPLDLILLSDLSNLRITSCPNLQA
jgi:hypothetical protein